MASTTPMTHPNAPHNQPFNVGARPCKSKKNSWWQPLSSNYWRNAKRKTKKSGKEVLAVVSED